MNICSCGQTARPRQRNCLACHAAAQAKYRAGIRERLRVMEDEVKCEIEAEEKKVFQDQQLAGDVSCETSGISASRLQAGLWEHAKAIVGLIGGGILVVFVSVLACAVGVVGFGLIEIALRGVVRFMQLFGAYSGWTL